MKTTFFKLPLLLAAVLLLMLGSCKKDNGASNDTTSAADGTNVSAALSSTADDVTNAVGNDHSISGKTDGFGSLCGATVTVDSTNGIVTITYSGDDCSGKVSRTGTLTITLEDFPTMHWKDAGATLSVNYNVIVTVNATNAQYAFNGTHYFTNITGGLGWKIMDNQSTGIDSIKHTATNFNITFPNGSQRTWSVSRSRTYRNINGVKSISISGDTTIGNTVNVDAWGTNRFGEAFVSALSSEIVSNNTCGYFRPVSGEYMHHVANRTIDILYGVDHLGNPETGGACAYGYKITYTKNNHTFTQIDSYVF